MNHDVKAYFEAAPPEWKDHLRLLHDAVVDCFPDASIDLRYRMPTYTFGDGWVAIASQKNYVSLYTCSAIHLEQFRASYPEYKMGKGCINFRQRDEIPVDAVKQVIRHAMASPTGHGS